MALPSLSPSPCTGNSASHDSRGGRKKAYARSPRVEDTVTAHHSKPCWATAYIAENAYISAGHTVSALHTMAVLQAFQTWLVRSLDEEGLDPESFCKLQTAVDLAQGIGRSMGSLVVLHRHLWLTVGKCGMQRRSSSSTPHISAREPFHSCESERLLHFLFSYPGGPSSQAFSAICIRGCCIPMQSVTVRAGFGPPYVYDVHECSALAPETQWNARAELSQRLAISPNRGVCSRNISSGSSPI